MRDRRIYRLLVGPAAVVLGLAMFGGYIEPKGDVGSTPVLIEPALREPPRGPADTEPELPRSTVETDELSMSSRVIRVPAAGDLQAAIDRARPGDRITLEQNATYRGPFRLPRKDGDGWIVITSSGEKSLPAGQRVSPSNASAMAKLIASTGSVIEADPGAHHYRFVGVEIAPADGVFLRALVQLGADEDEVEALPHHIIFDRCYLHGDRKRGARRGIAMNSRHTAVVDSYFSDFKEVGADSQAIAGWNGTGPFRIANNYLEAAGENVMFGGADPSIDGLVPSDIEVVGNHMAKPLRWKLGDSSYEGVEWSVKNLFELKNARRVLIDGNLFEYNWPHSQNGFAILFTVRNQDGRAPWSVVEDVTFRNNLVRHVAAGINVLGHDDIHTSQQTRRIGIRNNVFVDVGGSWGSGRLFQLLDGTSDVSIDHNTALQTETMLFGGDRAPHARFVFTNNIAPHNAYGVIGSGTGIGRPSFERYFPGAVVRRNVVVGGNPAVYPPDNFFPPSLDEVGFTDTTNHRLKPSSAFKRAGTDRLDVGADVEKVFATAGRVAGEHLAR